MSIYGSAGSVIPNLPTPPPVDYSSRDYITVLTDLINAAPTFLPDWTDRSPGDFGVVMLELFAYMADILNYYIDRVGNEAFLATAQQRSSVLSIAAMLDYRPTDNVAASVVLQFNISSPSSPITIPAGTVVQSAGNSSISFQTNVPLTIWGDWVANPVVVVTSTGLANQSVVLPGPFDGVTLTVTVAGVTWTRAAGNTFVGQLGTAQVYIVTGNIVYFGNGTTGAIPAAGASINITYYPAAAAQYSGTVLSTQGTTVNAELLGVSDGTPGQNFFLFNSPVINGSLVLQVTSGGVAQIWTFFSRLVDAGPTDQAYTAITDATGRVQVILGDGVNGLVPIPGASINANYQVGGGAVGNVSANTLTQMTTAIAGVLSVTNPSAASGGADAETMDHIRTHAPLSLTAVNRAVTLQDYAALALNIPTVAKGSAAASFSNAVTLYVHPAGGFVSDLTPVTGVLDTRVTTIANQLTNATGNGYLDTRKMATVTVQVLGPQYNNAGSLSLGYVPVDIAVNVQALAQYRQSTVQAQVQAALAGLLDFNHVDFGRRITLSSVYHTIQTVPGVDYVSVTKLCRHEAGSGVGDINCASYEIPQLNLAFLVVAITGGINY